MRAPGSSARAWRLLASDFWLAVGSGWLLALAGCCRCDCKDQQPGAGEQPAASSQQLYFEYVYQFLHRTGGFLERGVFVRRQLDLDDLLEPARAELAGDADELIAHAVLALQIDRARDDLLLVEHDRFDHLDDR